MSSTFTDEEIEFNSKIREYLNDFHENHISFKKADVYEQDLVIRRIYTVFECVNMNKDIIKQSKYDEFKKVLIKKIDEIKTDINIYKLDNCNYEYLFDLFIELEDVI